MAFNLVLATVLVTIAQIDATSFVASIDQRWPYNQWTTTLAPGTRPRPTTTVYTTTETPPPEVTFIPPLESEKDLLIVTDPNTGKMIYIPASVFWERFGGSGWNPSNRPKSTTTTIPPPPPPPPVVKDTARNPLICDFYAKNCWLPRQTTPRPRPSVPSGGGAGSNIYGFPGFHQGNFPSKSTGNGLSSLPLATRRPESMADSHVDLETDFETAASHWPVPTISEFSRNGYLNNRYPYDNRNGYYGSRSSQNRVYQPDLSLEDSQIYDQRHNHRHYYPNTFKRGYEGNIKGSGVGGTLPCSGQNCKENSIPTTTLPPLIRVTRPSVSASIPNPDTKKITETQKSL